MTAPFDWAGLIEKLAEQVQEATSAEESEALLLAALQREIEAAFAPKGKAHCETCGTDVAEVLCAKCGEWWRDNSPEVYEAAEAIVTLTAQLTEARASERAAVARAEERGVRLGIDAAKAHAHDEYPYAAMCALSPAAIIRADAEKLDLPDTLADSDGDDGA